MDNRIDCRIVFEKTGNAKYISHLDLNRCMQRAIRRSGLPAWYTEGFHPHMYLMFAMALSLGAESLCESMDVKLTQAMPFEEVRDRLNAALPEGLKAVSVHTPQNKAAEIGSAEYQVTLETADAAALGKQWDAFMALPEIMVEKKTKRGMKEIDIRPRVEVLSTAIEEGKLLLRLRLPAGNAENLNVSIVTDAFEKYAEQPFFVERILREKIFCLDGKEFL